MSVPTWAYIVGIVMMLFGGCGMLSESQSIMAPQLMDMQRDMFDNLGEISEEMAESMDSTQVINDSIPEVFEKMTKSFDTMFNMSEFSRKWTVRFGYMGIFVSAIYFIGGIFLLVIKRFSIKLAVGALALSIIFSIVRTLVMNNDPDPNLLMGMAYNFSLIFGTVINIILLIIVLASDKSAYNIDAFFNRNINEIGSESP